jgi:hypothetical protein
MLFIKAEKTLQAGGDRNILTSFYSVFSFHFFDEIENSMKNLKYQENIVLNLCE